MRYQLKFIKGELAGQVFPIENDSVSIGRSRSNDIILETPDISRKHIIVSNKGRGLFIDNLSSRQTIYGATELKMGDSVPFAVNIEVFIGKENSFILESYKDIVEAEDDTAFIQDDATTLEQKTIYEQTGFETIQTNQPGFTSATLETSVADDDDFAEIESEQTVGLKTRIATPEEIQMVKDTEKKKLTMKYVSWGAVAAIILVGLGFYYYFTLYKAPEPYILWPEKNGELCVGYAKVEDNNFPFVNELQLAFPHSDATKISKRPGFLEIITWAGKYADVPCFVRLEYSKNSQGLRKSRLEAFEYWMDKKASEKNSWNFDISSPVSFFLYDNGIPHYSVSYTRTEQRGALCGIARFFRFEEWQFALTVEIPANEKWRGTEFLNQNFIQFSENFLYSHWEGLKLNNSVDREANIYEAKILLSRQAPSVWGRVEYLLKTTLIACDKKRDSEQYEEAKTLLKMLRANQVKWFNEQKIAYYRAENLENEEEMKRITESCKAVFSSPEDMRFHLIRQDNWR